MATARKPTLTPILCIARDILSEEKKELHVNQIADIAVRTNRNMQLSAEDLAKKLSSALASNVKSSTSIFSKPRNKQKQPKKGIYKLKRGVPPGNGVPIPPPKQPSVPTSFAGRAGEYAVASELLYWGYNVATLSIDEGIDLLVETRPDKFKYVQVKTSIKKDDQAFTFKIDEKAFESTASRNPWYIFVMREPGKANYAIVPFSHLSFLRQQGVIPGKDLSISITKENNGKQYKLCGSDLNLYINNFDLLDRFS